MSGVAAPASVPARAPAPAPALTSVSARLLRWQRRRAVPVIALPLLGTACLLLFRWQPTPAALALFAFFYAASLLGVTVGFHRLLTHDAFACGARTRAILTALGCLAAEGPPIYWVANHRLHHQHSDGDGDPHSPRPRGPGAGGRLRSFAHAHIGWMLSALPADPLRYAPDLLKDRTVIAVNRRYLSIAAAGLAAPALIGLGLWGPIGLVDGLLWGGLARICAVQHVTWSINSVCHLFGARPFDTAEGSRNNALVALLAFGEGWHNNHHAAPTSAAHGLRWWQLDVSFAVIRLLRRFGLARDVRGGRARARGRGNDGRGTLDLPT
jgi:stearoyl-CoA desaturase (delta-9 desaturase)